MKYAAASLTLLGGLWLLGRVADLNAEYWQREREAFAYSREEL